MGAVAGRLDRGQWYGAGEQYYVDHRCQNGASGNGGLVQVQNSSNPQILGIGSYGIVAQSIGGGGGVGSNAVLPSPIGVTLGGGASVSGNGGAVTVSNAGWIRPKRQGAMVSLPKVLAGVEAWPVLRRQHQGLNSSLPQGVGTNSGDGNTVSVTNSGSISTAATAPRALWPRVWAGRGPECGQRQRGQRRRHRLQQCHRYQ